MLCQNLKTFEDVYAVGVNIEDLEREKASKGNSGYRGSYSSQSKQGSALGAGTSKGPTLFFQASMFRKGETIGISPTSKCLLRRFTSCVWKRVDFLLRRQGLCRRKL